jgi:hypothetical protein
MSRPVSAFLEDVVLFLEDDVLPEAHTAERYFDRCEPRVNLDAERVTIRYLSHCVRDNKDHVYRVNDVLERAAIHLEFQFHDGIVPDTWTTGLSQCTIGLHLPDVDTPTVFKWERRQSGTGDLKADERFDSDREFSVRDVSSADAIERGIREHLEETIPALQERSTVKQIEPRVVKLLYNNQSDLISELEPVVLP